MKASFKGIPIPPSANRIWRVGRNKVYRDDAYVTWKRDAGWLIAMARQPIVVGAFAVSVRIQQGKSRKDLDNHWKPLMDLLQAQGVIENDKLCRRQSMELSPDAWLVEIDVEGVA